MAQPLNAETVTATTQRWRGWAGRGAVRIEVGTLIASIDDMSRMQEVEQVLREVARDVAVRTVTVAGGGGVRGAGTRLWSLVEPLVQSGLPVTLWFPDRLPRDGESLGRCVHRVVLDTSTADLATSAPDLLQLAAAVPVSDLAWLRLQPWRQLIAGMFDMGLAAHLGDVRRVESRGSGGDPRLLAAWLSAQLGLAPGVVRTAPAGHASVRIITHDGTAVGRFDVTEAAGDGLVRVSVDVDGRPSHQRTAVVRTWTPAGSLVAAITRGSGDAVWQRAVAAVGGVTHQG